MATSPVTEALLGVYSYYIYPLLYIIKPLVSYEFVLIITSTSSWAGCAEETGVNAEWAEIATRARLDVCRARLYGDPSSDELIAI